MQIEVLRKATVAATDTLIGQTISLPHHRKSACAQAATRTCIFWARNKSSSESDSETTLLEPKLRITLWKDADPDIPILKQAKAEYAKLR